MKQTDNTTTKRQSLLTAVKPYTVFFYEKKQKTNTHF